MLILATISVNVIINGELFNYASEAKKDTEIVSEKQTLQKATIVAQETNKTGKIIKEELQKALNNIANENTAEAIENGETIVVKFNQSNRYYEVNNEGKVDGPKGLEKDEYAGDVSKGGKCDGSEEKPFEINCIEDLVEFSIMTNDGNEELGIAKNNFQNKYVVLKRTLDFKSIFSYNDYTTKKYGDLNTDGIVEDIKTELTKTLDNCIGFTGIRNFGGNFNGNGNEIKNIYINCIGNAGLFAETVASCVIINLGITGDIKGTQNVGGIIGYIPKEGRNIVIKKCYNKSNIYNSNNRTGVVLYGTGGIIGYSDADTLIEDCYNLSNVESISTNSKYGYVGVGGILGKTHYGNVIINNCYNEGTIIGNDCKVGGITGVSGNIYNSYNIGKIIKGSGIIGFGGSIYNCYNLGSTDLSGINGGNYASTIKVYNVYTTGNITNKPITLGGSACKYDIKNAFYSENAPVQDKYGIMLSEEIMKRNSDQDTEEEKTLLTLLNEFANTYNEENKLNEDFIKLNIWKIDSRTGYPSFK